jgi:hypothetical protein
LVGLCTLETEFKIFHWKWHLILQMWIQIDQNSNWSSWDLYWRLIRQNRHILQPFFVWFSKNCSKKMHFYLEKVKKTVIKCHHLTLNQDEMQESYGFSMKSFFSHFARLACIWSEKQQFKKWNECLVPIKWTRYYWRSALGLVWVQKPKSHLWSFIGFSVRT